MPRTVRSAARDRTLGTGMPHAGFIFFADPDMILLHLLWMLIAGLIGALIARLIALFAKNARYAYGRILLAGAAQTGVCWAAREWVPHDLSVVLIVLISGILLYRHLARGRWPFSIGFALLMIPVMIATMRFLRPALASLGLLD